jgi:hypothetical protein
MRMASGFFAPSGDPRGRSHPNLFKRGGRVVSMRPGNFLTEIFCPSQKKQGKRTKQGGSMKKLLLIALVASGLAFVPAQRSDAQVYVGVPGTGVGVGVGFGYPSYGYYYGYPRYYGGYYPYSYYGYPYRTYYYGGPSYYWYNGHRVYYRHHRHHHYYHSY